MITKFHKTIKCNELDNSYDISFIEGHFKHCCKMEPIKFKDELDELKYKFFDDNKISARAKIDLRHGIRTSVCNECWADESKGILSWRQLHEGPYFKRNKIIHLNIEIFSQCNHACMYCVPELSSSIRKFNQWIDTKTGDNIKIWPQKNININFDHIINFLREKSNYKQHLDLGITGGEPFVNFNWFMNYVEEIITAFCIDESKSMQLNISTNGNQEVDNIELFYEKINKLKEEHNITVAITSSIENLEERAEYIRYGLKWDNFVDNFKIHHKHADSKYVRMTLNPFSIVNIVDFFKYFLDYNVRIQYNYPFQLFWRINILDDSFLNEIKKLQEFRDKHNKYQLSHYDWIDTLHIQIENNTKQAAIFKNAITNMDKIKNTNWRTVFPEYIEWFDK